MAYGQKAAVAAKTYPSKVGSVRKKAASKRMSGRVKAGKKKSQRGMAIQRLKSRGSVRGRYTH